MFESSLHATLHSEMTSVAGKAETQAFEMECLVFSKKYFVFVLFLNSEEEYHYMLCTVNLCSCPGCVKKDRFLCGAKSQDTWTRGSSLQHSGGGGRPDARGQRTIQGLRWTSPGKTLHSAALESSLNSTKHLLIISCLVLFFALFIFQLTGYFLGLATYITS